jgi:DNA-binding IclR family transcriptional regulator
MAASDYAARLIQRTRARGYADRQREIHAKTSSIAVPIRYCGRVVACMNVVWIASAMEFSQAEAKCYPALAAAQEKIERELINRRSARENTMGLGIGGWAERHRRSSLRGAA